MIQSDKISVGQVGPGSAIAAGRGASATILNNIQNIQQRALTAAEEAKQARDIELELLAQGVGALAQRLQAQAAYPLQDASPYKGLLAYGLSDAETFCGRAQAIRTLLDHMTRGTLTVLHAESGAGKTSLLQAGIAARLIEAGHLAVFLRPYDADPAQFVKRTFLPDQRETPRLASLPLREFLRHVCGVIGPQRTLYLLLDQFEEFFVLRKKPERDPFIEQLAECLGDPSLNVRWVLAMRGESLTDMDEFESHGITWFQNIFRLNRLSRIEAQEVMTEPAARRGLTFETGLVETILGSLESDGQVAPTQLQLVCSALTEDLSTVQMITRDQYNAQGGTEGILRDYLKQQLAQLPAEERELARRLLRVLVTSDLRRDVRSYDELAEELRTQSVSRKSLDMVLAQLVERRLLLVQERISDGERTYELAHDYLVREIELDPQEQARKAAQELLEQEIRICLRHGTLIAADRLKEIEPYRDELRFTSEAKTVFNKSVSAIQREQAEREAAWQRELEAAQKLAEESEAHRKVEAERAQEAVRSAARLRTLYRIATVVGTVAVVAAIVAIWFGIQTARQRDEANRQRQTALIRQLTAQAQTIASNEDSQWSLAGLLTAEALNRGANSVDVRTVARRLLEHFSHPVIRFDHGNKVTSVVFSPDGQRVATIGAGNAKLWDSTTGKLVGQLKHANTTESIRFSPDGKQIATIGQDETAVMLWDAKTLNMIAELVHPDKVWSMEFLQDGKYLLTKDAKRVPRVWDTASGMKIAELDHGEGTDSVFISHDGQRIATVGGGTSLWEASTGKEILHLEVTPISRNLALSPDGRWLAADDIITGDVNIVRIWDTTINKEVAQLKHPSWIQAMDFSPDGKWLATGGGDNSARIWETSSWNEVARLEHKWCVKQVSFSPDGQRLGTRDCSYAVHLWAVDTHKEIAQFAHGTMETVVFSPDGQWIITGNDNTIWVWETATGREVARLEGSKYEIDFSPDGRFAVLPTSGDEAILWELSTGKAITRIDYDSPIGRAVLSPDGKWVVAPDNYTIRVSEAATGRTIRWLDGWLVGDTIMFSPNGKLLATGSLTLQILETEQLRELAKIEATDGKGGTIPLKATFSPNGRWIAVNNDKLARVWETQTGKEVARFEYSGFAQAIGFSPDGKLLFVSTYDPARSPMTTILETANWKQVGQAQHTYENISPNGQWVIEPDGYGAEMWNLVTGGVIHLKFTPPGDDSPQFQFKRTYQAFFSPNGKWAVTVSRDLTVRIWDVATGQQIVSLQHSNDIESVSFSSDSQLLATTDDKAVQVWKTDTWKEIARLEHDDSVDSVAFSSDGRRLATASGRVARIWSDPLDLLGNLCSHLPRNLTQNEWQQYFPDEPYRKTCPQLPESSVSIAPLTSLPQATSTLQPVASPVPVPKPGN